MTMHRQLSTAAVSAVVLVLAACGGGGKDAPTEADFSAAPKGPLKTLGFNPSDEVGSARSDLAAKNLADVKVDMDTSDFDPQKFAALSASGNVPDLVQIDRNEIGTYAQQGLIQPMDACFSAHDVKPTDYWYDAVAKDITYDGKTYGAPQFFQAGMLIFNKRTMEKAGVTVEQLDTSKPDAFIAAVKQMNKVDGTKVTQLGFDPDLPGSMNTWFAVFGGATNDDTGAPTLDSPENVQALQWAKDLMDAEGGYEEVTSFKQTWDVFGDKNQFVTDQSGGGTWAQWYINVLSGTKDDVDVVAVPIKDKDGKVVAMAGGTALAIPAQSKNPGAACAWAVEVTSEDAWKAAGDARAAKIEKEGGINTGLFTGSPVADQAVKKAHVKPSGNADFDQLIDTSYAILPDNRSFGSSPVGSQMKDAVANAVGAALGGQKTPEQALKDAQTAVKRDYDKVKK